MLEFKEPIGILRYLVGKGRGDEIDVTVSCNETVDRPPRLIITYPNTDHWASCRTFDFNQSIQVKIKHKVFIKGYSFEKFGIRPGVYMMNWKFLGSNDGINWDELDKHTNDASFSNTDVLRPKTTQGIYNYFRILNTGLNHYDSESSTSELRTILYIRYLDLYGILFNDASKIKKKEKSKLPFFIWIILNDK